MPTKDLNLIAIIICIAVLAVLLVSIGLLAGLLIASLGGLFVVAMFVLVVIGGDGPDFGES